MVKRYIYAPEIRMTVYKYNEKAEQLKPKYKLLFMMEMKKWMDTDVSLHNLSSEKAFDRFSFLFPFVVLFVACVFCETPICRTSFAVTEERSGGVAGGGGSPGAVPGRRRRGEPAVGEGGAALRRAGRGRERHQISSAEEQVHLRVPVDHHVHGRGRVHLDRILLVLAGHGRHRVPRPPPPPQEERQVRRHRLLRGRIEPGQQPGPCHQDARGGLQQPGSRREVQVRLHRLDDVADLHHRHRPLHQHLHHSPHLDILHRRLATVTAVQLSECLNDSLGLLQEFYPFFHFRKKGVEYLCSVFMFRLRWRRVQMYML
ncbi:uncharacterized protein LOC134769448 [Penaeus indicus]|uniref:uncharacterized protein LOC134769448 n=1 Tax=Penaeus indicus TaxID=29960 RepID=UPI00300D03C1